MKVHNVQSVSDISIRNIYQKASADSQNLTMSNPRVTSLNIKNLYNRFRQAPSDFIKLVKPVVLSLALRNLYNKIYPQQREYISIDLPTIVFLEVRPLLQKLRTWGLDETLNVTLPHSIEIHKKDVVNLYDNPDIIEFKLDTPEPLEVEVKNILNKNTQRGPDFEVGLPDGIELGGSVKPVLTFPVLEGEIVNDRLIGLTWDDTSITHTGYTIYRSLEPIPVDTSQEPYIQLGRDIKQFDDLAVDENTTYFYRVTPKTVYGNLFSNLLSLHVPLYLRAPRNFEVGFQGLSLPINGMGGINTLSKIWTTEFSFLSTEKASSVSGEYAYQIFIEDPLYRVALVERPYEISGTSKLEHVLRGESSKYTSLQNTQDNYVEFFNDVSLYGVEAKLNKVLEPVKVDTGFAGITKGFIKNTFVILGSLIENRHYNFESITEATSIIGYGSREMILHQPEAFIHHGGQLSTIAGVFSNATHMGNERYHYSGVNAATETTYSDYTESVSLTTLGYSYVPVNKASGEGSYEGYLHVRNPSSEYLGYRLSNILSYSSGLTATDPQRIYCILGSDAYGVEYDYTKAVYSEGIQARMLTLDKPYEVVTVYYEDQEFTIFSGYLPPVGYPMEYLTYRVGTSIVPVFAEYPKPGDSTSFTLYEKMIKSREIRTGYTPPKGTEISFSLFIED